MLATLIKKVPHLRVVIRPVSTGLDPWGEFGLDAIHEPAMTSEESLSVRNQFWTTVEALCGDR